MKELRCNVFIVELILYLGDSQQDVMLLFHLILREARFEGYVLKVRVVWDVSPCRLVNSYIRFEGS
jgi:hypothetical protein